MSVGNLIWLFSNEAEYARPASIVAFIVARQYGIVKTLGDSSLDYGALLATVFSINDGSARDLRNARC
jgi:hypothetical protein